MNKISFIEKSKKLLKKVNKKTWITSAAVLIIGVAVLLNVIFLPENNAVSDSIIEPKLDLSNVSASINEQEFNLSDGSSDAFVEMSLNRQQARDEALEVLKSLTSSDSATEIEKQNAAAEIKEIATYIESEANIESLIKAKGFEECVAVLSEDSASIIIKAEGLAQNQIAQISEIVYQQAGIHPSNLNIIESN